MSGVSDRRLATVPRDFAIECVAQQRYLLSEDAAAVVELRHLGKQFDDEQSEPENGNEKKSGRRIRNAEHLRDLEWRSAP
jgi:hypothetical protein